MGWLRLLLRAVLFATILVAASPAAFAVDAVSPEPACVASIVDHDPSGDLARGASDHCGHHCQSVLPCAFSSAQMLQSAAIIDATPSGVMDGLTVSPLLLPPIV